MSTFLLQNHQPAFVVGLTGGIASGKSEVEQLWSNLGVPVLDIDKIVRKLLSPGTALHESVLKLVGPSFLLEDGNWNRPILRRAVFESKALREEIETYSTPAVMEELKHEIATLSNPYVVISSALMVDPKTGLRWSWIDWMVTIDTPEQLQINRLMNRDKCSLDDAHLALSIQSSRFQRKQQSDWVLQNFNKKEELKEKIEELDIYLKKLVEKRLHLKF